MYCRKTFEELLDTNSPVKPFSLHYNGQPCDLKNIPCMVETGKGGNRKMIYEPGTGLADDPSRFAAFISDPAL